MKPLFEYSDYVSLLSHKDEVVRMWAFNALESRYSLKFTPEIAYLIGDSNEHLACAAPRYLARHGKVDHAPQILNSFQHDKGLVPSNCASALGVLNYLPALDKMLKGLSHCESMDTLLGICSYLGSVKDDECRYALRDIVKQLLEDFSLGDVSAELWRHGKPEDVAYVLDLFSGQTSPNTFLRPLIGQLAGNNIFDHLVSSSEKYFIKMPRKFIDRILEWYPSLNVGEWFLAELMELIVAGQFNSVCTELVRLSEQEIETRYKSYDILPIELGLLHEKDEMALAFIKEIDKSKYWSSQATKSKDIYAAAIAGVTASYLSILRRGCVAPALNPRATHDQMMACLLGAGTDLPKSVIENLIPSTSVEMLCAVLSDGFISMEDVPVVALLGRYPEKSGVMKLFQIMREADKLSYVHDFAAAALREMEQPGPEMILQALLDGGLEDTWDILSQLEYLPYPEAYELAIQNSETDDDDSLESYAYCLAGIGDPRGISELQKLFATSRSLVVGEPLETLAALHGQQIPELPKIRRLKRARKEFQAQRQRELAEIAKNLDSRKVAQLLTGHKPVEIVTAKGAKVGRNDPCPCGSGKKYKKCCLIN